MKKVVWSGEFCFLLCHTDSRTRMHVYLWKCGKMTGRSRDCGALVNVILETLDLAIHLDVSLTNASYLHVIVDQVDPLMADMISPDGLLQ